MSIVCYVHCLSCLVFVMSVVCYVLCLLCPLFVMSSVCYVQCLLCPLFVMSAVCFVRRLLCPVFVMSSVCYVQCLFVQGLSCLLFVCPGFDVLPLIRENVRILFIASHTPKSHKTDLIWAIFQINHSHLDFTKFQYT